MLTTAQAQRQAAVDLHRRKLGDWCPGLGDRSGHDVIAPNRLTAAAHRGGLDPRTLAVLCSSCALVLRQRQAQPPARPEGGEAPARRASAGPPPASS